MGFSFARNFYISCNEKYPTKEEVWTKPKASRPG